MGPHFSPAALKFLKDLAKHNDREWFLPRKPVYDTECRGPLLALVEAVSEGLPEEFQRDPAKVAMRPYRDVRFSKSKLPYKTNLAAWWARRGLEKTSGGGFYFEWSPAGVVIAAGCYLPEREQLLAIRRMLMERGAAIEKAMKCKGMEPFDGLRLTRAPKGFPPDAPALVLQRQWGVMAKLPVEAGLEGGLMKEITSRFKAALPLVSLLNEPLMGAAGDGLRPR